MHSKTESEGTDYGEVLKEARDLGHAESELPLSTRLFCDPSVLDRDAAILSRLNGSFKARQHMPTPSLYTLLYEQSIRQQHRQATTLAMKPPPTQLGTCLFRLDSNVASPVHAV